MTQSTVSMTTNERLGSGRVAPMMERFRAHWLAVADGARSARDFGRMARALRTALIYDHALTELREKHLAILEAAGYLEPEADALVEPGRWDLTKAGAALLEQLAAV
jgi:hypothetical protein